MINVKWKYCHFERI